MPPIVGISFGQMIPYPRVGKSAAGNHKPKQAPRSARIQSISDFAERAAYRYQRSTRVINQYKMYNKRVDTPTIGTIVNLAF